MFYNVMVDDLYDSGKDQYITGICLVLNDSPFLSFPCYTSIIELIAKGKPIMHWCIINNGYYIPHTSMQEVALSTTWFHSSEKCIQCMFSKLNDC